MFVYLAHINPRKIVLRFSRKIQRLLVPGTGYRFWPQEFKTVKPFSISSTVTVIWSFSIFFFKQCTGTVRLFNKQCLQLFTVHSINKFLISFTGTGTVFKI